MLYPYQIELVTPESAVNDKGKFIAAGIYHRFTISSTKPVNVTDKPAFGDYIVQSGNAPMTLLTKNYISYVRKINGRYKNNQPQWRFVPVAIICAFVFIGAVIFAKLQTQKKLADEQPHALSSPNTVGEILRENSLQPQDSTFGGTSG